MYARLKTVHAKEIVEPLFKTAIEQLESRYGPDTN